MDNEKSITEIKSFDEFSVAPETNLNSPEPIKGAIGFTTSAMPPQERTLIVKPKVEASEGGVLMPRDFEGAYRMATILCESKTLPQAFDTPAKVFAAMQLAYELGLTPMIALRQMMVLNGTPQIFGDLPLSLAIRSGNLKDIREWWFDKDGNDISAENKNLSAEVFGATCIVERHGFSPVTRTFTMADAQRAGLTNKGPWKSYGKRMLQCRTRAWALKDRFADVLNGVSILEYNSNTLPEFEATQPGESQQSTVTDKATSLNDRFGKRSDVVEAEFSQ